MFAIIKDNLEEELTKLGFFDTTIKNMCNKYVNKIVKIYDTWVDKDFNQEYATIDLCVEIPVQCLEYISSLRICGIK